MKRCPNCGAKNKARFNYCVRCSEPLDMEVVEELQPTGSGFTLSSLLSLLVLVGLLFAFVKVWEAVNPPDTDDIEVPVALIRPGNGCVGIGALLEPYTYTLSARCKEKSRLTVIAGDDLRDLFKSDPEFGKTVMNNLAQRLLERLIETREEVKIHFMNLIQSATFS